MSLFRQGPIEGQTSDPPGARGEPRADETAHADAPTGEVPGERGIPSVNRVRSVQSRVSSVLTVTLMALLAGGLMIWYYSGAINRTARAHEMAAAAAKRRATGETSLPSLGVITPPKSPAPEPESALDKLLTPPPSLPVDAPEIPLTTTNPYGPSAPAGPPPPKTPAELELERRLGGPVLAASSSDRLGASAPAPTSEASVNESPADAPSGSASSGPSSEGSSDGGTTLASLLKPTATPAVRARVLPTRRFMLPKGAFIDCTLETAINSSLPGMTTCVTATDTFGADGNIVLLERGSKLVGETRGQVQQGSPRLFVLWTEARTPTGVVVPLASPGTDELGRSGLSGTIDRHWWLRFGTAILITVIDGAVQGFQSRSSGNSIVLNPSTSNSVATEALRGTLNIPPTIEKAQGDRIQILVARDVDFRSVYALHASAGEP
jgi:type IV secretion system protein VirB10